MGKTVYRSKIDWWVWATVVFAFAVMIVCGIGSPLWFTLLYTLLLGGVMVAGFFGCWYAIEGRELLVYQFFRPTRLPVDKIKEVKYCSGILAGPAMSTRRLSIKFTDRSVLRSSFPIEISPRDRDGFVRHLLEINPTITVVK